MTHTENSKYWPDYFGSRSFAHMIYNYYGVNKQIEPGSSQIYRDSNILSILLILLLIYLLNKKFDFISIIKNKYYQYK